MDIKTALSVYNKPWLIEPGAAVQLMDYWEQVMQGNAQWNYRKAMALEDDTAEKPAKTAYNMQEELYAGQKVQVAPESVWGLYDFKGFDGAETVIIPMSGPLMKGDFCGYFGTASLKDMFQLAENTASVKNIILQIDSPGGTVDGTQAFADTIKASKKNTISLVEGLMCSAAYWIGSASKEVYASSDTDIIGSIGTMCSLMDNTKAMEARGVVIREFYATASKDKNGAFAEAIKGDGKKLIAQTLDPLNNVFLNSVRTNRADKIDQKKEDVLTGKTYVGKASQEAGLIDGIQSLSQVITQTKATNKKIYSMSKPTLVFQNVLKATGAEKIDVVDNGFLMTEQQLITLDNQLKENATTIRTMAGQIANPTDPAGVEKTKQDLATANTRIIQLEGELKTANTAKEAAEEKAKALGKQAGAGFTSALNDGDPKPAAETTSEYEKLNALVEAELDKL